VSHCPRTLTAAKTPMIACVRALGFLSVMLFSTLLLPCWPREPSAPEQSFGGSRVEVTIVARGSSVASGTGSMDSYLAVIASKSRGHATAAVRLVDYHSDSQPGISDERISGSRRPLRLRLSYASYCNMDPNAFVVRQIFDENALAQMQGIGKQDLLPCYIVR
jgi:hypothetical protein